MQPEILAIISQTRYDLNSQTQRRVALKASETKEALDSVERYLSKHIPKLNTEDFIRRIIFKKIEVVVLLPAKVHRLFAEYQDLPENEKEKLPRETAVVECVTTTKKTASFAEKIAKCLVGKGIYIGAYVDAARVTEVRVKSRLIGIS